MTLSFILTVGLALSTQTELRVGSLGSRSGCRSTSPLQMTKGNTWWNSSMARLDTRRQWIFLDKVTCSLAFTIDRTRVKWGHYTGDVEEVGVGDTWVEWACSGLVTLSPNLFGGLICLYIQFDYISLYTSVAILVRSGWLGTSTGTRLK